MNALNPASSSKLTEERLRFTSARPPSLSSLVWASEIQMMEPPPELIPGFLNQQGFAVLYAKPAACKSFLAQHLAMGLATGTEAWGHRAPRSGTIYLAGGEGVAGLRNRFDAWCAATGQTLDDAPFFSRCPAASLTDAAATRVLADGFAADLDRAGHTASLIVVDRRGKQEAENLVGEWPWDLVAVDRFADVLLGVEQPHEGALVAGKPGLTRVMLGPVPEPGEELSTLLAVLRVIGLTRASASLAR